ncbi:hypothetical protein TGAMA5MH_02219 [Trichoderma gamsii]|uniref:Uncharacterized protein n=1 Tax=Trichoderma gamsii TaxID=398673 RepID=A0A2K0TKY3_9HYPO|nr:hypothetical protein TGAMA5MH_02219 [Trichoderma gamsii]
MRGVMSGPKGQVGAGGDGGGRPPPAPQKRFGGCASSGGKKKKKKKKDGAKKAKNKSSGGGAGAGNIPFMYLFFMTFALRLIPVYLAATGQPALHGRGPFGGLSRQQRRQFRLAGLSHAVVERLSAHLLAPAPAQQQQQQKEEEKEEKKIKIEED